MFSRVSSYLTWTCSRFEDGLKMPTRYKTDTRSLFNVVFLCAGTQVVCQICWRQSHTLHTKNLRMIHATLSTSGLPGAPCLWTRCKCNLSTSGLPGAPCLWTRCKCNLSTSGLPGAPCLWTRCKCNFVYIWAARGPLPMDSV